VFGEPPCHPIVRVLEQLTIGAFVFLWHWTVWWCTGQSGAPLTRCSDFCRDTIALSESTVARCQSRPLRAGSHYSAGSPDSPVNYSGAHLNFPESGCLAPVRPWCSEHCPVAHRTVRCARPQHKSLLLLLNWVANLNILLVCVEPYAPVIHVF
jgi:hypothetical protein